MRPIERSPPLEEPEPTLRMPAPGGLATAIMKRLQPQATHAGLELQRLVAGINPLLGAAATLLALTEQLRNTGTHDDPAGLRLQLLQQVALFEAAAGARGVARPKVTAARYLLCSFLDEAIAATPWGEASAERSLLQEFHEERSGADKAFQLLERLGQNPADNADLLELFYVCLRLGFEGRYRGTPEGRAQLDAIAARVLEVVRPNAAVPARARTLSEPEQGVTHQRLLAPPLLPPWLLALLAGGVLLGLVLMLGARLDSMAQPVFRRLLALPPALNLQAPGVENVARARLAPRLQAEIARGALVVRDEALRSVITLPADALFVPGSARIEPARLELLQRVAQVLNETLKGAPGQVAVIGHTDDVPVASLQFSSAWQLSHERARAVQARLVEHGIAPEHLRAEGRADAEPLLTRQDAAARAANRRVEIELRLTRPEAPAS